MWNLSDLTGLEVRAPLGFATGSFQNILSEWSGGDQDPAAPALCYVTDSVLLGWCRQAQWIEEVLVCLRKSLELQLQQASLQARCRALGLFLWENISLDTLGVCGELSEALTEGLTALNRQNESRPVEFLSSFLMKWSKEDGEMSQGGGSSCPGPPPGIPQTTLDWRCSVGRELLHSERLYLGRMRAVLKVEHQETLTTNTTNNASVQRVEVDQSLFSCGSQQSGSQRNPTHTLCAPCLHPGRAALFVGLCDRAGRGEGQLPVCAAFRYKLLPDRTSVNLRRRYLQHST
ncbi:epithelial cell-transforming sequence 2 oncogene-like isoform X1 [Poecilia latipinna]|uniref:epithelial cell-transforming sequence 2 oncogene-like isoform X1 n=1 Tax=Poecilia latipinna TaxID=48699 RepID=UPI00072DFB9E|nr:PREDICTED: epithelial cell-transforming sequence 2 oncogene-like isoform X1 [Poecilia latipinna]